MRGQKTEAATAQDGATAVAAGQAKPRARRARTEGVEGGARRGGRRAGAGSVKAVNVFGPQTALFDRMQHQAELATIMKKHLEAMRADFGKLAPGVQAVCDKLIEKAAQSGMDTLMNMNLVPKPDMLKPLSPKDDLTLKKAVETL